MPSPNGVVLDNLRKEKGVHWVDIMYCLHDIFTYLHVTLDLNMYTSSKSNCVPTGDA